MTYVVLLNWNGWLDTISCMESLFRLSYSPCRIIVCDNNSSDESIAKLKSWLNGDLIAPVPDNRLASLVTPPCRKPISWVEYDRAYAEQGGDQDENAPVVIINTGGNLGFAGGNNVGLRYILSKNDADYIWLLNNDTLVDKDSLTHLVNRASRDASVGIVGSTLCYFSEPEKIQARGGATFDPWRMKSHPIDSEQPFSTISNASALAVEEKLGYVIGASMLVSANFLKSVGLMYEDYFLYYEELDWAERAKPHFTLAYAPDSLVYHKVGASAGTAARSFFSLNYLYLNQLKFTQRFYPKRIILARLSIFIEGLKSIKNGFFAEGFHIIKLSLNPIGRF